MITGLSSKLSVIERDGIQTEINVMVPAEIPISNIDLCTIFANCLDNALEACRKCPEDSRFCSFLQGCVREYSHSVLRIVLLGRLK